MVDADNNRTTTYQGSELVQNGLWVGILVVDEELIEGPSVEVSLPQIGVAFHREEALQQYDTEVRHVPPLVGVR